MSLEYKLHLIAKHYGLRHQLEKTQEELRELDEAITHHVRYHNPFTKTHVAEEVADVFVTCKQILDLMGVSTEEVLAWARYKVTRQMDRIAEEEHRE